MGSRVHWSRYTQRQPTTRHRLTPSVQIQIGVTTSHGNHELERWCRSGIDSSKHLSSILDNVLDQSKLEAGKLELEELPVNLCEVCHTVKDMLWYVCVLRNPSSSSP